MSSFAFTTCCLKAWYSGPSRMSSNLTVPGAPALRGWRDSPFHKSMGPGLHEAGGRSRGGLRESGGSIGVGHACGKASIS